MDSSATGHSDTSSERAPATRNARLKPQNSSPPETLPRPLEQAESVHYVCASTQILSPRQVTDLMRYRNQWMVDHCTKVVALYDGTFGGTAQTVSYAAEKGVPVDNLWQRWTLDAETRALLA